MSRHRTTRDGTTRQIRFRVEGLVPLTGRRGSNPPSDTHISSHLMRYRDQNGQDWADIIDFLTMHPVARRRVVRLLAEIDGGAR
jgi:hypothetical protein